MKLEMESGHISRHTVTQATLNFYCDEKRVH